MDTATARLMEIRKKLELIVVVDGVDGIFRHLATL